VQQSLKPRRETKEQGAARGESCGGYWEGETSESKKPKDGFGMKYGRCSMSGAKRQEVEKT
jgi:hypothetical protein